MSSLRWRDDFLVGLSGKSSNGEIKSKRPSSNGRRQSDGIRIFFKLRAEPNTDGTLSRSKMRKHSFSTGE